MTFRSAVTKHFAFLCEKYGFNLCPDDPPAAYHSVVYEKAPFVVEMWWGKGEVDVLVRVTIDTTILRPYRTKTFPLWMIVRRINPSALNRHPPLPQFALSVSDAEACLKWEAKLMSENCDELLRGDIKVLEDLSQEK